MVSQGQPYKKSRRSEQGPHAGHPKNRDLVLVRRIHIEALKEYVKRDDLTHTEHDTALAMLLELIQEGRNG